MELIHALERVQSERGFLSEESLRELATETRVPLYRLQALVSFYPHFRTTPRAPWSVDVCRDMSCFLNGADTVAAAVEERFATDASVSVRPASCLGCCELAPALRVNGRPQRFEGASELAARIAAGAVDTGAEAPGRRRNEDRRWRSDPYADVTDRYSALRAAVQAPDPEASRDAMVATLDESGLRGMGGAGFPTGLKWKLVRQEKATPKYVVCNADESEPGTFKDRVIMEELPHLVIEGMALGGFAIGATEGIIYLRHEYAQARDALEREIETARKMGALGPAVFDTATGFDIQIFVSPGGYILGEETALLEALEDKRGEPRNKPPFPGQRGLWGRPTLMNNVETLAFIPGICLRGAEHWKSLGTNGSSGLKFVAVSGHVRRPGVYEISCGIPVRELIEAAGGVSGDAGLKGFAPGGASSNFLPASAVETPFDFDPLDRAGSMMGSGALVVVAEGTPMLPLATNVVRFFRNESCGKCVPCRDGTEKAVGILERALDEGTGIDWETIEKLQLLLNETSICGLGYVALNPLLSAARHWPDEIPRLNGAGQDG